MNQFLQISLNLDERFKEKSQRRKHSISVHLLLIQLKSSEQRISHYLSKFQFPQMTNVI